MVRVRPPPVPVTVTVAAATSAVAAAVKVTMVLSPVAEAGTNAAVTPPGSPAALNATALAKPFSRVMVTVLVAEAPGSSVTLAGSAASEKSGAAFTVRAIAVVRVRPPPVPVTVTVAGPRAAVAAAVKVTTVLLPVVEAGTNAAVTPAGSPVAVKATAPAKPPVRVMVTVLVAEAPRTTVTLAGLAASVKFGAAFTVSAIVVVRASPPPVPVMVTVAGPSVAVAAAVNVTVDELPVVEARIERRGHAGRQSGGGESDRRAEAAHAGDADRGGGRCAPGDAHAGGVRGQREVGGGGAEHAQVVEDVRPRRAGGGVQRQREGQVGEGRAAQGVAQRIGDREAERLKRPDRSAGQLDLGQELIEDAAGGDVHQQLQRAEEKRVRLLRRLHEVHRQHRAGVAETDQVRGRRIDRRADDVGEADRRGQRERRRALRARGRRRRGSGGGAPAVHRLEPEHVLRRERADDRDHIVGVLGRPAGDPADERRRQRQDLPSSEASTLASTKA